MKIEGTPEATIVSLWEFAVQECGHSPASSEPPLAAVRREVERLRSAILSFGNGNDFDWNVLARIDELERETERLRAGVRLAYDYTCGKGNAVELIAALRKLLKKEGE